MRLDTTLSGLIVPQRGQEPTINIPGNAEQVIGTGGNPLAIASGTTFIDSASFEMKGRWKMLYLLVTAAIPKTAAAQSLVALYTGLRKSGIAPGGAQGGTSQIPAAGGTLADQLVLSTTANLGPNAASLAIGLYVITPTELQYLQWDFPWLGIEINLASATNAATGAIAAWIVQGAI